MTGRRRTSEGSALVIAILLIALAGVLATALTELGRAAVRRARLDRDGVRAWYLAESGLAETIAALPPGRAFTAALAAFPGPPAAAGPAWTYAAGLLDDADEIPRDDTRDRNARVILRVNAFGPAPVRRRLEAAIGRAAAPLQPGALTLTGDARTLTADFLLDGRDFDMSSGCTLVASGDPRAGLSLPDEAGLPVLARPDHVVGRGSAPSIERHDAPPFAEVATAEPATHVAAGVLPATLGAVAAPRFTRVDGDAVVDATTSGAGALYVAGRLRITGRLAFTGMLAAAGGIELAPGATLEICGGAWASGTSALDVQGTGFIRASSAALRMASTLAPLPARARVLGVREPS
jgi:hypothetical protein